VSPAGERLWFSGDATETIMKAIIPARCAGPVLHRHLQTEEDVTVVSGRIRYHLEGRVHELEPGDSLRIPRLARHRFENPYSEAAELEAHVHPGLVHEVLLRLLAGASSRRRPNPLEMVVAFHDGDGYPAQVPAPIARVLVTALRWLSETAGVARPFRAAHLPDHLLVVTGS
jgi:mannose-6-phosphate isomerase-like protein (cupin superfamily)